MQEIATKQVLLRYTKSVGPTKISLVGFTENNNTEGRMDEGRMDVIRRDYIKRKYRILANISITIYIRYVIINLCFHVIVCLHNIVFFHLW